MVRQRDIKATINAATNAGLAVKRLKLDAGGNLVVEFNNLLGPATDEVAENEAAEWDALIEREAKAKGERF
ncbi:hypothetical protein JEY40_31755 [Bradyrhizobium japonicum]|uniref:hypothetical protein n=1 Tax=Bradyrhizobium japonicum TaxID=375 RepID=UPI00200F376D|nr:hypothetical protein [Bradyrhizobium japonicum]UQD70500.1 hypothetical protein JEY40_31755 [Bradyrhizobium japonicum]